jgi:hypothetical protein
MRVWHEQISLPVAAAGSNACQLSSPGGRNPLLTISGPQISYTVCDVARPANTVYAMCVDIYASVLLNTSVLPVPYFLSFISHLTTGPDKGKNSSVLSNVLTGILAHRPLTKSNAPPPTIEVKEQGCKSDHSPPSGEEVKNGGATRIPPHPTRSHAVVIN